MHLSLPVVAILTISAVITSVFSGMLGMAGGVLMLAVIAMLVEAVYVVPLHAVVQFVSCGTRVSLFFKYLRWPVIIYYVIGLLPGTYIGILIFDVLPKRNLKLMMAVFILGVLFFPRSRRNRSNRLSIFLPVGIVTGAIGVLFGATGPFIAPFFLRRDIVKEELVATKAACHMLSHLIKLPFFGFIGINVFNQWRILLLLSAGVIVGTLIGKKILKRIDEALFIKAFRVVVVLMALQITISELIKML